MSSSKRKSPRRSIAQAVAAASVKSQARPVAAPAAKPANARTKIADRTTLPRMRATDTPAARSATRTAKAQRQPKAKPAKKTSERLASALRTLDLELQGLSLLRAKLVNGLGAPFEQAVERIRGAQGRVIVTGIGKSGHVCRKIAATLASTGTPSYFVHPSEASHGDLGMITREDVILALSWSGEPVELAGILHYAKRFCVPVIAMTSNPASTLGKAADIPLILPKAQEACPHGLAPTTSTTMQLALGDALAVALLESRGFTAADFKQFHPGGKLGASLRHIGEIMHKGDRLPVGPRDMPMSQALVVMTEKSFGCIGIVGDDGKLAGIVTDGDLRRHMGDGLLSRTAGEIMTASPRTVTPDTLAAAALATLGGRITALFVVEDGRPVGIVHVHDLLRTGAA